MQGLCWPLTLVPGSGLEPQGSVVNTWESLTMRVERIGEARTQTVRFFSAKGTEGSMVHLGFLCLWGDQVVSSNE